MFLYTTCIFSYSFAFDIYMYKRFSNTIYTYIGFVVNDDCGIL